MASTTIAKIKLYAYQYALNIVNKKSGYTLIKARSIFRNYFYLVQDNINTLKGIKEMKKITNIATNAYIMKALDAFEKLNNHISELHDIAQNYPEIDKIVLRYRGEIIQVFELGKSVTLTPNIAIEMEQQLLKVIDILRGTLKEVKNE